MRRSPGSKGEAVQNLKHVLPVVLSLMGGIGLIRLLLAASVVIEHSANGQPPFNFVNGIVAVQSFYMISGFYMALILTKKYDRFFPFITNRLLRIYPIYYIVLFITIVLAVVLSLAGIEHGFGGYYREYWNQPGFMALLPVILTNVTVFGQDVVMFLGVDFAKSSLYFTKNFRWSDPGLWNFLLIPQAWTLSIELIFYLCAPFLNKWKSREILALIVWSLTVRFLLIQLGYDGDPWTYRFFPNEIAFFGAGMLAYRIYQWLSTHRPKLLNQHSHWISFAALLGVVNFSSFPIQYALKRWGFYLFFWIALPWVFSFSQKNLFDRKIGELSYPVYISHILIIGILQLAPFNGLRANLFQFTAVVIGVSVTFSVFLNHSIQIPIDRFRQRRVVEHQNHAAKRDRK